MPTNDPYILVHPTKHLCEGAPRRVETTGSPSSPAFKAPRVPRDPSRPLGLGTPLSVPRETHTSWPI
jgi:hypothetical protein